MVDSFRTITTLQEIEIDPKITLLIGANESGKTNLLHAIRCFSLNSDFQSEDTSRSKRSRYKKLQPPTLTFVFSLSEEDIDAIVNIIPEFPKSSNQLQIIKNSNGIKGYSILLSNRPFIQNLEKQKNSYEGSLNNFINANEVFQEQIKSTEKNIVTIENDLKKLAKDSVQVFKSLVNKRSQSRNKMSEITKKIGVNTVTIGDLRQNLFNLQEDLRKSKKMTTETKDKLKNINVEIEKVEKRKQVILKSNNRQMTELFELIPQISYYKDMTVLPESILISDLIEQNTPLSITIAKLLRIGGIEDLRILQGEIRRVKPILVTANELISEKLSDVWKQERLELELSKDGDELSFSIREKIAVSASPLERSEGFQWFLSFFSNFMPESNEKQNNKIILLDEPAIKLHAKGQKDFLSILENMSEKIQVIYTSHSPFLINRNFPQRIRLLEKKLPEGTSISNKPWSDGKRRFWEPLKSAIGICLGDLFSMGEMNLIVEGISDQMLITGISQKLASIGQPFIDLEKTTIMPSGGANESVWFGHFSQSENLKTIVLLDNDDSGISAQKNAEKKYKKVKIITVNQFKKEAITIEDLIPVNDYINAVNSFYKRFNDFEKIEVNDLPEADIISKGIVKVLREQPKNNISFNKVLVVNELIRLLDINKKIQDYAGFSDLVKEVNINLK